MRGALQRVFTAALGETPSDKIRYPHVEVEAVRLDLVEDGFRPVSRDGAGMVEVAIRLQKTLSALAIAAEDRGAVFSEAASDALRRALAELPEQDGRSLRAATGRPAA